MKLVLRYIPFVSNNYATIPLEYSSKEDLILLLDNLKVEAYNKGLRYYNYAGLEIHFNSYHSIYTLDEWFEKFVEN